MNTSFSSLEPLPFGEDEKKKPSLCPVRTGVKPMGFLKCRVRTMLPAIFSPFLESHYFSKDFQT
jgi:hypothetical protein